MQIHPLDVYRSRGVTILTLRTLRVILDKDLARLYGVTTRRLNEQVRRNRHRFPQDFAFPLLIKEKSEVVANCDHLSGLKFSSSRTWAFTEHGVLMAAGVLNSRAAIAMSIFLVRAFVELRREVTSYRSISARLDKLEGKYDARFHTVFEAIRDLMRPVVPPKHGIGFRTEGKS